MRAHIHLVFVSMSVLCVGLTQARAQVPEQQRRAQQPSAQQQSLVQAGQNALAAGKKPIAIPLKDSAAEIAIRAAMEEETAFSFADVPLKDAMRELSTQHNIPIILDVRALEEIGLGVEVPVTASLKGVSLRSAFRILLRDLELTYMIKDELLQITTAQAAEHNLVIKMYALPGKLAAKSDKVIQVIPQTVVPDTWDVLGGPSTIAAIDHVVIVSTTSEVHDQIEPFLAMLIKRYAQ